MKHTAAPREAAIREACADAKRHEEMLRQNNRELPSSPRYLRAVYRVRNYDFAIRRERAYAARFASTSPLLREFLARLARRFDSTRHAVVWLTLRFEDGAIADHAFFAVETALGVPREPLFSGTPQLKRPQPAEEDTSAREGGEQPVEGGRNAAPHLRNARPRCSERELLWRRAEGLLPTRRP